MAFGKREPIVSGSSTEPRGGGETERNIKKRNWKTGPREKTVKGDRIGGELKDVEKHKRKDVQVQIL